MVGYLVNVQEDFGWGKGVVWVLGDIDGSGWWGRGCVRKRRAGGEFAGVGRGGIHLRLRGGLVGGRPRHGGRWPYH